MRSHSRLAIMTLPRLALSVIGDEIGPSLEEMISFAHEHGLKRLDMRTVGGRNLLGMPKEEIIKISRTLENAGLTVPTFVSPLFKWPAAGKAAVEELVVEEKVEEEAEEEVVDPREKDREVVIYLRPLVDIANAWATGEQPSDDDIASLAPLVTAIHLKDRDLAASRTVPLGDGNVPWPAELKRLLGGVTTREVLASIETHCPQDGRNPTARSIAGLRRIAAEIGVEIV